MDPAGIVLSDSVTTQLQELAGAAFPLFSIQFPSGWSASVQEVSETGETIVLSSERGVTVTYMVTADPRVPAESAIASVLDVTQAAPAGFVPGTVGEEDLSDIGAFMVASLDRIPNDGEAAPASAAGYALIPASMAGVYDSAGDYGNEFCFFYGGFISLTAEAPDGIFTPEEAAQVQAILQSFRAV